MSQWWVFHEDKVDEAIKEWMRERSATPERLADWDRRDMDTVRDFLNSAAVKRLGMRKE